MKLYLVVQLAMAALAIQFLTGCMQLTGAKKITMGTWSIEANSGFDVSAGVQQYDFVNDKKGYNVTQKAAE